jgi:methylthioribulose-1-phosphate dehydratase
MTSVRRITILTPASYVWGDTPAKAKTQCESLDYLFQLAVEMHKLGLPWDINRNQK